MKRICLYLALISILIFYQGISYPGDETTRHLQPQEPPTQRHQTPQETHATQPILPPTVPSSPVSPTPSPHIAAPLVTNTPPITTPPVPASTFSQTPIQNMPSVPVQATVPVAANVSTELPQPAIIGNSIGEVIDIGKNKDGSSWIQVRDDIFNETLKIKVNPGRTPVIKKTTVMGVKDIKIGDMVSVIFNQQGEDISANFVSILTEEDLKLIEESIEAQSNIAPVGEDSSISPSKE